MSSQISRQPQKFRAIINVIQSMNESSLMENINSYNKNIDEAVAVFESDVKLVSSINNKIVSEIINSTRLNKYDDLSQMFGDIDEKKKKLSNVNIINVYYSIITELSGLALKLKSITNKFTPVPVLVSNKTDVMSVEDMRDFMFEYSINEFAVNNIIEATTELIKFDKSLKDSGNAIKEAIESYSEALIERFSEGRYKIYNNPLITDIAITIHDNISYHGDIQSSNNTEISSYSLQKANVLISGVHTLYPILSDNNKFIELINTLFNQISNSYIKLQDIFGIYARTISSIIDPYNYYNLNSQVSELDLGHVGQLLMSINDKFDINMLSPEEKLKVSFINETIEGIVDQLPKLNSLELSKYILERKAKYKVESEIQNTFFVCKMGAGNAFLGEAPGALTIIPGIKPNEDISNILGSGYNEVREFIGQVDKSHKWANLFMITSPSKSVDKANILLIGPPGCGKTSVMRSVASNNDNVAIYAQGSDFLTCWKGEAEKNPKRLFEQALKVQKSTQKHVHILIDEIDSVLKKADKGTDINLSLEFQTLMDGIVSYPKISIWGTTNNPENIPMPMIRRFSKILIVGKLSDDDIIKLLKLYVGNLPTYGFKDADWERCALSLRGATGDVVRKVADSLWRSKMSRFVSKHESKAIELSESIETDKVLDLSYRKEFLKKISAYITVEPNELAATIRSQLLNVGINAEIEEAIKTYKKADSFINGLERNL